MKLEQNQKYRAKAKLSALESMMASNAMLQALLVKKGFRDVVVTGTGLDRVATAIWDKPTAEEKLPKQIIEVTKL